MEFGAVLLALLLDVHNAPLLKNIYVNIVMIQEQQLLVVFVLAHKANICLIMDNASLAEFQDVQIVEMIHKLVFNVRPL